MILRPRILLSVALGGLVLVLASLILLPPLALDWRIPQPLPPELTPLPSAAPLLDSEGTQARQIVERPLFWASRRPQLSDQPRAAEQAAPEDFPKGIRLVGLYSSGEDSGAIIITGGEIKRLPTGAKLSGWQLKEARDGFALFLSPSGKQQHELSLRPTNTHIMDKDAPSKRPANNLAP